MILASIYSAGTMASATLRNTNDSLNAGVGGALLGAFIGGKYGTVHNVFVGSVGVGAVAVLNAYAVRKFQESVISDPALSRVYLRK